MLPEAPTVKPESVVDKVVHFFAQKGLFALYHALAHGRKRFVVQCHLSRSTARLRISFSCAAVQSSSVIVLCVGGAVQK